MSEPVHLELKNVNLMVNFFLYIFCLGDFESTQFCPVVKQCPCVLWWHLILPVSKMFCSINVTGIHFIPIHSQALLECSFYFNMVNIIFCRTFALALLKFNLSSQSSVDPAAVSHHGKLAANWWDESGSLKALHSMNCLRWAFRVSLVMSPFILIFYDCKESIEVEAICSLCTSFV